MMMGYMPPMMMGYMPPMMMGYMPMDSLVEVTLEVKVLEGEPSLNSQMLQNE